jgi:hypothetical protein
VASKCERGKDTGQLGFASLCPGEPADLGERRTPEEVGTDNGGGEACGGDFPGCSERHSESAHDEEDQRKRGGRATKLGPWERSRRFRPLPNHGLRDLGHL